MCWLTGGSSGLVSECPLLGIVQTAFMLFEAVWWVGASLPESKTHLKIHRVEMLRVSGGRCEKINRNTQDLLHGFGVQGPLLRAVRFPLRGSKSDLFPGACWSPAGLLFPSLICSGSSNLTNQERFQLTDPMWHLEGLKIHSMFINHTALNPSHWYSIILYVLYVFT